MPKGVQIPLRIGRFRTFLIDLAPGAILGVLEDTPATRKFIKTQVCRKAFKFPSELAEVKNSEPDLQTLHLRALGHH